MHIPADVENLREIAATAREESSLPSGRWRSLKAYVRNVEHIEQVRSTLPGALDIHDEIVSIVVADICRSELLVEVEGIHDHA